MKNNADYSHNQRKEEGDEHKLACRLICLFHVFAPKILRTDHGTSGRKGKKGFHNQYVDRVHKGYR